MESVKDELSAFLFDLDAASALAQEGLSAAGHPPLRERDAASVAAAARAMSRAAAVKPASAWRAGDSLPLRSAADDDMAEAGAGKAWDEGAPAPPLERRGGGAADAMDVRGLAVSPRKPPWPRPASVKAAGTSHWLRIPNAEPV